MEVRLPKTLRRMPRSPPETNARMKETQGPEALSTYRSLPEDTLQRGESKPAVGGGEDLICHCQGVPGLRLLTPMENKCGGTEDTNHLCGFFFCLFFNILQRSGCRTLGSKI